MNYTGLIVGRRTLSISYPIRSRKSIGVKEGKRRWVSINIGQVRRNNDFGSSSRITPKELFKIRGRMR